MLLEAIYYFLPAYAANIAPTFFQWLPFKKPLDLGLKYRKKRLLGKNKTIRGFLVAIIIGLIVFYLQIYLYQFNFFKDISLINYSQRTFLLGFLLSFGSIFGDTIESFFKRQKNIPSGKSWIPLDQLDYVIVALLLSFIIYVPKLEIVIILLIISPLFQLIFHYLGYILKINKEKI